MRRCTGPLSFEMIEKPNGLQEWGEAYLSNAPSHPAGNTSFVHSFKVYTCPNRGFPSCSTVNSYPLVHTIHRSSCSKVINLHLNRMAAELACWQARLQRLCIFVPCPPSAILPRLHPPGLFRLWLHSWQHCLQCHPASMHTSTLRGV